MYVVFKTRNGVTGLWRYICDSPHSILTHFLETTTIAMKINSFFLVFPPDFFVMYILVVLDPFSPSPSPTSFRHYLLIVFFGMWEFSFSPLAATWAFALPPSLCLSSVIALHWWRRAKSDALRPTCLHLPALTLCVKALWTWAFTLWHLI